MAGSAYAACPNDCAGHGVCGDATQCECYRNWFGADCSDRICTYSAAFVDTPVGDLNGDGEHGPARYFDGRQNSNVYGVNYVSGGQSELYAWQYGYARNGANPGDGRIIAWDEAHFYRECANKGTCDRTTGQCSCFPGYEGEGCTRTTCPLSCSGHGKCRTLNDHGAVPLYSAWDGDHTQDCVCDAGYSGAACQMRDCPRGADPVEYALAVTNSVQGILWQSFYGVPDSTSEADQVAWLKDKPAASVYYTYTYEDEFGDPFTTSLLSVDYKSSCQDDGGGNVGCLSSPDFSTQSLQEHAEAVNNSLQALSLGAIENSYVWTVGADYTSAFAGGNPTQTFSTPGLEDGVYPYDVTTPNVPKSVSVEALAFRLDRTIVPSQCRGGNVYTGEANTESVLDITSGETTFGLCTFVQIENPGVQEPLTIQYWYTPGGDTVASSVSFDVITGDSGVFADVDYELYNGAVVAGDKYAYGSEDGNTIVTVANLQDKRSWNPADGDVTLDFVTVTATELGVCSARGLCDYDTGMCDCFAGYSGLRCDDQNAIAYSY